MDYPRSHRALEIASISALTLMVLVVGFRVCQQIDNLPNTALVGAMMAVSYLAADFFSGFVHWLFDRYGDENTPIAGPNFIRHFRDHHVDPLAMTRHDFIETNGNNSLATLPLMAWACAMDVTTWSGLAGASFIVGISLGVFCTNQFHSWAHLAEVPAWISRLQRTGLILNPAHHARHHDGRFDSHYCITSGWMNRTLSRWRFFERLERVFPPTVKTPLQPSPDHPTIPINPF